MTEDLKSTVRAAAHAGWWTVAAFAGVLTLQYLAFLYLASTRPAWMLALWGGEIGWPALEATVLWAMTALKIALWLMICASLWLTLWARRLK